MRKSSNSHSSLKKCSSYSLIKSDVAIKVCKQLRAFLVERALSRTRLLKCSRFFSDLVCRPRVPSEDRGNWG